MTSITKNLHPSSKKFFHDKTRRLAMPFEHFTGSVVLTGPDKILRKAMCVFFSKILESGWTPKCKTTVKETNNFPRIEQTSIKLYTFRASRLLL